MDCPISSSYYFEHAWKRNSPMSRGRPKAEIVLSEEQRSHLLDLASSRALAPALARRARIVLDSADGFPDSAIARRVSMSNATVARWRRRYLDEGTPGLRDKLRSGRPRTFDDAEFTHVIRLALHGRPPTGTRWSVRSMAEHTGVSKSTIQRWFDLSGIRPDRHGRLEHPDDLADIDRVHGITGLYLDVAEHALVLCSGIPTQDRRLGGAAPIPPPSSGCVEGVPPGCARDGTASLLAALDAATRAAPFASKRPRDPQEYVSFLRCVDANVPTEFHVHVVVDDLAIHDHPVVKTWRDRKPRHHVHLAPAFDAWLAEVERWLGCVEPRAGRPRSSISAKALVAKIARLADHREARALPFMWTATPQAVLASASRHR